MFNRRFLIGLFGATWIGAAAAMGQRPERPDGDGAHERSRGGSRHPAGGQPARASGNASGTSNGEADGDDAGRGNGPGAAPEAGEAEAADIDRITAAVRSGDAQPLKNILDAVRNRFGGKVLRVRLLGHATALQYNIRILSPQDRLIEVRVNARTGQIIGSDG